MTSGSAAQLPRWLHLLRYEFLLPLRRSEWLRPHRQHPPAVSVSPPRSVFPAAPWLQHISSDAICSRMKHSRHAPDTIAVHSNRCLGTVPLSAPTVPACSARCTPIIHCPSLHGGIVSCYPIVCKPGLGFALTEKQVSPIFLVTPVRQLSYVCICSMLFYWKLPDGETLFCGIYGRQFPDHAGAGAYGNHRSDSKGCPQPIDSFSAANIDLLHCVLCQHGMIIASVELLNGETALLK